MSNSSDSNASNKPAVRTSRSKHFKFRGKLSVLLEEARRNAKLSQRDTGKLLDVPGSDRTIQAVVSSWENGYSPIRSRSEKQRATFAELLGVSEAEFDRLVREDEVARARVSARRNAKKAVLRQYHNPTATKKTRRVSARSTRTVVPAPVVSVAPETVTAPIAVAPDLKDAMLLALIASDPALSSKGVLPLDFKRVLDRYTTVLAALAQG